MILDLDNGETVLDIKEKVRDHFSLGPDQSPSGIEGQVRKTLAISYCGSVLKDRYFAFDCKISKAAN